MDASKSPTSPAHRAAAAYLSISDTRRRLRILGQAVFVGAWLGVLDHPALHAIDDLEYRRQRRYRSPTYNRRGLFPWEREMVQSHFPDRGRLMVIGAGGGREVLALSAMGYDVAGLECNHALIEAANRLLGDAGSEARVGWLPRDAAPQAQLRYDGSIVGWGAYMLMAGSERRIDFLRGLADSLQPGAPILISFFTWDGRARYVRWVYRVANAIRRALRRERVELGDDLVPNYVHRFTAEEVERELGQGGFELRTFREQGAGPDDSGFAVGVRS